MSGMYRIACTHPRRLHTPYGTILTVPRLPVTRWRDYCAHILIPLNKCRNRPLLAALDLPLTLPLPHPYPYPYPYPYPCPCPCP
jgi:hypothetical protein